MAGGWKSGPGPTGPRGWPSCVGVGRTGPAGGRDGIVAASSTIGVVHDVQLTDNPGNWFDAGVNYRVQVVVVLSQPALDPQGRDRRAGRREPG
jgi:hypothetical protein